MQASTESLLNKAMELNTDIQEDCLHMLNIKNDLNRKGQLINHLSTVKDTIKKSGIDKLAFAFLNETFGLSDKLNVKWDDLPKDDSKVEYVVNKIDSFIAQEKASISNTLTNMLELSMQDLDKKTQFNTVVKDTNKKVVVYHETATENLIGTLSNLLQNISFYCSDPVSNKELVNKISNEHDYELSMLKTKISTEGFVTMDIPQPSVQTLKDANLTVDKMNDISNKLNSITYPEMRNRLANLKLSLNDKLCKSKNVVPYINYVHCLSQLIMSTKNAIMTVQNYHNVAINELNN